MRRLTTKELLLLGAIKERKKISEKLRVGIYARKSSEDEFATALDSQIAQCKDLISKNADVLELNDEYIFSEENKSGMFTDNREEFNKLIQLVKDGKVDVVVVHTPERFSRNVKDFQGFQDILKQNNAILLSTDIPTEESAMGEFIQNITIATSQMFVRQTAEKTFKSLEHKAQDCRVTGGVPNYGYKYEADRYVIDPEESVAIEMMFNGVLDGKTYDEIINELDALGHRTRAGKKFSKSFVNDVLNNVKYCGTYLYNKKGGKRKKHRVLLGEYDEVRIEGGITEPIIDKKTFDRVQGILQQRTQCRKKHSKPHHLLTGLIKCKKCGAYYVGNTREDRHKKKQYSYICQNRFQNPKCDAKEIKGEYLENYVKAILTYNINEMLKHKLFDNKVFLEYLKLHKVKLKTQKRDIQDYERKIEKSLDLMIQSQNKIVQQRLEKQIEHFTLKKQQKETLCQQYLVEAKNIEAIIQSMKKGTRISEEILFANPYKAKEICSLMIKEILIDDEKDIIQIELN